MVYFGILFDSLLFLLIFESNAAGWNPLYKPTKAIAFAEQVSQILVSAWYEIIPDSTIVAAILDRIVHTAIRMDLKGDSLRKNK